MIKGLDKCKIIARTGIGVDNVDLDAATKKGIMVTNVPSYCEDEVSDHALALILSFCRKICYYSNRVRKGDWDWKGGKPLYRLKNQTLGIVALGKIARLVAKKAAGFGFNIVFYDPYVKEEEIDELHIEKVEFKQLLEISDIISVHTPLTDETRHLFGEAEFQQMKGSAYLINTSRGPIIEEEALYKALSSGAIAGAGLDVLESEPPDPDNPLFELDNVILTPHTGWYSEDSETDLRRQATKEIVRVLQGKKPLNLVNKEVERQLSSN